MENKTPEKKTQDNLISIFKFSWEREETERTLILRAYKAMMRHA